MKDNILRATLIIKNLNCIEMAIIDEIWTNPKIDSKLKDELKNKVKEGDRVTRDWFAKLLENDKWDKKEYIVLSSLLSAWGFLIDELYEYSEEVLNEAFEAATTILSGKMYQNGSKN